MSGNFAIKGGGVGRLMANAILNFHFDFPHPSLRKCCTGPSPLQEAGPGGNGWFAKKTACHTWTSSLQYIIFTLMNNYQRLKTRCFGWTRRDWWRKWTQQRYFSKFSRPLDICKFLDLDQQAELEDTVAKTESQGKLIIQLEDHVEQLQAISTPYRYVQVKKLFLN